MLCITDQTEGLCYVLQIKQGVCVMCYRSNRGSVLCVTDQTGGLCYVLRSNRGSVLCVTDQTGSEDDEGAVYPHEPGHQRQQGPPSGVPVSYL